MSDSLLFRYLATRRPVLLRTVTWTLLLLLTVTVVSIAPEAAFTAAISPSSALFSRNPCGCSSKGFDSIDERRRLCESFVRIPVDVPGQILCVPETMVGMSEFDFLLPTVFAAVAVFASACLLRSLGLWEEIIDGDRG